MPASPATRTTTAPPPSLPRRSALAEVSPTPASALAFSESVRIAVAVAHQLGLTPPVFRSPPGIEGVDRTIRRTRRGSVIIAVRRTGRPLPAVQSDIIDGLVAANRLTGADADGVRRAVWERMQLASPPPARRGPRGPRRVEPTGAATADRPESLHAA